MWDEDGDDDLDYWDRPDVTAFDCALGCGVAAMSAFVVLSICLGIAEMMQ